MTRVRCVLLALVLAAAVAFAQTPAGVKTHIGHVMTSFNGTPTTRDEQIVRLSKDDRLHAK